MLYQDNGWEKNFPSDFFANSNITEKCLRVCLKEEKIPDLPENSQDIFWRIMLDSYKERQNLPFANGKYATIDSMCYAEFLRYLTQMVNENDYQKDELTDQLIQGNRPFQHNYQKVIPLTASKEKLDYHKISNALQYYKSNRHAHLESYHHVLLSYVLFIQKWRKIEGQKNPAQIFAKV